MFQAVDKPWCQQPVAGVQLAQQHNPCRSRGPRRCRNGFAVPRPFIGASPGWLSRLRRGLLRPGTAHVGCRAATPPPCRAVELHMAQQKSCWTKGVSHGPVTQIVGLNRELQDAEGCMFFNPRLPLAYTRAIWTRTHACGTKLAPTPGDAVPGPLPWHLFSQGTAHPYQIYNFVLYACVRVRIALVAMGVTIWPPLSDNCIQFKGHQPGIRGAACDRARNSVGYAE